MKITCTGRKVTLKDAFLERVDAKLAKLDKFFSDAGQAQVTVTVGTEIAASCENAAGEKCPRCWKHSTTPGTDNLCPRCAAVVATIPEF